ncbi:hypothetical protein [Aliidiomarina indica]|uniref:hypothetical protein n=1 Tax=Aliidiomarina indica TaxID=2749147 RepID=UPI001890860D|nr:hypothetical protein [Aliidiomarina indica]
MSKTQQIPPKYSHDWLEKLDGRTAIAKALQQRHGELVNDLGGQPALSYQRLSLTRRAIHMEAVIEQQEQALARGEDVDTGKLTQSINSLIGLYKTLGLDRVARDASLSAIIQQSKAAK